jgi:hypothetical protein
MTDRTMVPEGGVGRDTYAPPGNMGVVSSQETNDVRSFAVCPGRAAERNVPFCRQKRHPVWHRGGYILWTVWKALELIANVQP